MLVLSTLYRDNPVGLFTQATEIGAQARLFLPVTRKAACQWQHHQAQTGTGTPFWVITNTNTSRKQNMVAQLMTSMGYGDG